jgi:hypothetical protein
VDKPASDRLIMLDLIVTMQIAFYMHGGDENFAKANEAMRTVAKNAIKNKRIPRSLYFFASALASPKDVKAFINQTHAMYESENPGESNGTLAMPT